MVEPTQTDGESPFKPVTRKAKKVLPGREEPYGFDKGKYDY